jgi:UDP-N-acetylglucosamine--N-acetylmuramyl-(pentapeptide) pyrophosphoryl-undecaprenol N-acetylglucosamine transferase
MTAPSSPCVVLAAGGTGGHVFPAEALAAELLDRGVRLVLFTDRRGGAYGGVLGDVEMRFVRCGRMAGRNLIARLQGGTELALGFFQARSLLKRTAPRAAVGFGGYASVPTMLAAAMTGVPTLIHEQNAILGRANRLLAARVARVATAFDEVGGLPAGGAGKIVRTGMPVRPAFAAARGRPYARIESGGPVRLLVLGGSQGARVFSDVVPAAVERMPADARGRLAISQQCRPEDLDRVRAAYEEMGVTADLGSFFDDVPDRLASAHLVIARSGASTVGELTAVGRPAVLVPYPHAIDDHQTANARALDAAGAAWLVPQDRFSPESLAARLASLLANPAVLETAADKAHAAGNPDAARRLADAVLGMVEPNGANEHPADGRQAA